MSKHNKGNGIQIETENATTWILNKAFMPTGRIKRMRRDKYNGLGWCKVKTFRFIASPVLVLELTLKLIPITRWNRH